MIWLCLIFFSNLQKEPVLTDNDELDPDGVGAESVDALAVEDAGVLQLGRLDLQNFLVHFVAGPGEVDRLTALKKKQNI